MQQGVDRERHRDEAKAYHELFAKLVEAPKVDPGILAGLSTKLVPLGAEYDTEAYLVTFEHY